MNCQDYRNKLPEASNSFGKMHEMTGKSLVDGEKPPPKFWGVQKWHY